MTEHDNAYSDEQPPVVNGVEVSSVTIAKQDAVDPPAWFTSLAGTGKVYTHTFKFTPSPAFWRLMRLWGIRPTRYPALHSYRPRKVNKWRRRK